MLLNPVAAVPTMVDKLIAPLLSLLGLTQPEYCF